MSANNYCNGPFCLSQAATKRRRSADDGKKAPPAKKALPADEEAYPEWGVCRGKCNRRRQPAKAFPDDELYKVKKDIRCKKCSNAPCRKRKKKCN